jgi:hypothetical protein
LVVLSQRRQIVGISSARSATRGEGSLLTPVLLLFMIKNLWSRSIRRCGSDELGLHGGNGLRQKRLRNPIPGGVPGVVGRDFMGSGPVMPSSHQKNWDVVEFCTGDVRFRLGDAFPCIKIGRHPPASSPTGRTV